MHEHHARLPTPHHEAPSKEIDRCFVCRDRSPGALASTDQVLGERSSTA